jgi:hypothetical protein
MGSERGHGTRDVCIEWNGDEVGASHCQSLEELPSRLEMELAAGLVCRRCWNVACIGLLEAVDGVPDEKAVPLATCVAGRIDISKARGLLRDEA